MKVFAEIFPQGRLEVHTTVPANNALYVNQVHGKDIIWAKGVADGAQRADADGLADTWPLERPLAIKTADCLPILLLGEKGVALIHAGWRGLAAGILRHPDLPSLRPTRGFIGPHISCQHYQVGHELKKENLAPEFFCQIEGQWFFDLAGQARRQLLDQFPALWVGQANWCTYAGQKLFSARRGHQHKRNWNIFFPSL